MAGSPEMTEMLPDYDINRLEINANGEVVVDLSIENETITLVFDSGEIDIAIVETLMLSALENQDNTLDKSLGTNQFLIELITNEVKKRLKSYNAEQGKNERLRDEP